MTKFLAMLASVHAIILGVCGIAAVTFMGYSGVMNDGEVTAALSAVLSTALGLHAVQKTPSSSDVAQAAQTIINGRDSKQ